MTRGALKLALLATLPITLAGTIPAQGATQISSFGYVITAPGVYQVTQDLAGSGNGITILASNVNLHLNGHTLSGDGGGAGIYVQNAANISIQRGTVQGFNAGIELWRAVDCKVANVTARQNSWTGIVPHEGTLGLTVTGCTATQNGHWGIAIQPGSRATSVTGNTFNGNGLGGMVLVGSFANTVTNNTANNNGCSGIEINSGASANTVERNTTDRNGCFGIGLFGNSNRNTVTRNSATANGNEGIILADGSSQNRVQNNTVSGSSVGILLRNGANQNIVQGNSATLNVLGIWLDFAVAGSTIQGNTALNNRDWDMGDQNGCNVNTWNNNQFVTDLVAGVPDGGPNAGCIR